MEKPEPENATVEMLASDECLAGMVQHLNTGSKPDFTVTKAHVRGASANHLVIAWETVSAGFGELTFYLDEGTLKVDTEAMSPDFVTQVVLRVVYEALKNSQ